MIRVLIADDHSMIRAGLKSMLADAADIKVVAEADNGDDALRLLRSEEVDVALLDLDLPGKSGFEIVVEAKRIKPDLPILIVSLMPEEKHATRLFKAGATGYIMKDCEPEEFIKAVKRVASGQRYISTRLAEQLYLQSEEGGERLPHTTLSEREYEIFELIVAGKPLIDIAAQLHISEKTVSTHRARILEKMNMTSNAALITYAVKNGLI
ncbi:MAG: response regulator transcription factor [Burkholderiales bacterium]|nr:response regulator transcription factor [Burkholderiales bacterium]